MIKRSLPVVSPGGALLDTHVKALDFIEVCGMKLLSYVMGGAPSLLDG